LLRVCCRVFLRSHKKRKKDLPAFQKSRYLFSWGLPHTDERFIHLARTRSASRKENRSARSSRAQSSDEEEDTHAHTRAHVNNKRARINNNIKKR
jgi:hypothetical protein